MLRLVGVSRGFDAQNAAHLSKVKNQIVRLAHGVYCDESDLDDLPIFMRKNALRIANYLFPKTALMSNSAYYSGAVESSRSKPTKLHHEIFLGSTYSKTVELEHLDIILSKTLKNKSLHQFCLPMEDHQERDFGPLRIQCASDELIFLQNFGRKRYNVDRFLDGMSMLELRNRLRQKHGDLLVHRLKTIASTSNDFHDEIERALSYLSTSSRRPVGYEEINTVFEFTVGWFGRPIGKISMNGVVWSMDYVSDWKLPLACKENVPGRMPSFVHNLFPEGHQMNAIQNSLRNSDSASTVLSQSERYLSNISIVEDASRLKTIPVDRLHGRLENYSNDMGLFQGRLVDLPEFHPRTSSELDNATANPKTPRISGNQAKLPCFLDEQGCLMPAIDRPFTHILKFPGFSRDTRNARGAMEWLGMSLARGSGLHTASFALVDLENGSLGCLVERFDIPRDEDDMRLIFSEDFCSAAGLPPQSKMMIDEGIEDVICLYLKNCTPNRGDALQLLKLIYVNLLEENGDFHLKNAAVVRVAEPTLSSFRSTRLSPAFDIMNSRYFSDFAMSSERRETMVLDYKGRGLFSLDDLIAMGCQLGLDEKECSAALKDVAYGMASTAQAIANQLPAMFEFHPQIKALVFDALARASYFCRKDFPEIERFVHPEFPESSLNDAIPHLVLPPAPPSTEINAFNIQSNLMRFDPLMLFESLDELPQTQSVSRSRARL